MKKLLYGFLLFCFFLLFIIGDNKVNAQIIKYNKSPTEIMGNWYFYIGGEQWTSLKIDKHKITSMTINQNKKVFDYQNWQVTGVYKSISQDKHNGFPNISYDIQNSEHDNYPLYMEIGSLSPSKVKYKGNKVLISYSDLHYSPGTPWTNHPIKEPVSKIEHEMGIRFNGP